MVNIYPDYNYNKLELSESLGIEKLTHYLYEATEILHTLHNKGLTHGRINSNSFILKKDKVCLTGFGYAPILTPDNMYALKDCGDFIAPELLNRLSIVNGNAPDLVTPLIDIYCFAKTIGFWLPSITESSWYSQATSPEPSQRYSRMRKVFTELEKALIDIYDRTKFEAPFTPLELTQNVIPSDTGTKGGLIPKYTVELTVEPPEAGRVEGSGKYSDGKEVKIKTVAFPDWEFIGWKGDVVESEKNFSLIVSKNIKLIACFKKQVKSSATIHVEILPSEARDFVKVNGTGNYVLGTTVHMHAWSVNSEKWRFARWEGDKNSYTNPLIISVTKDLKFIAKFEKVNITMVSQQEKHIEPGNAFSDEKEILISQFQTSSPPLSRKLIGEAFKVDDNQQSSKQNMSQDLEEETHLGTAFITPETEEPQSTEISGHTAAKKPIIGSAFED
ncbi:MAG: hypothetical protein N5P05_001505 [Chroococcopsis gigantea SAG 12.99]|nr:hypothetical protein [Chroococcopsis gigantea SAG 12.99]